MKITVLIENSAKEGFACEHGLSLLIEHNYRKILLDSGTTVLFAENADKLGVELCDVDTAVLSHGHYDHSGGFEEFFRRNNTARVHALDTADRKYFSASGSLHEIGIPENVLAHRERFAFHSGSCDLGDGIYLVSHSTSGLDKIGEKAKLFKGISEGMLPDDFSHEQSLVIDTEKGLVVINSCSHGGAANIIAEARVYCRNKPVYAYFGGLHMMAKFDGVSDACAFSAEELDSLCNDLKAAGVERIYTGHCTGISGFNEMKARLGDVIQPMPSGSIIEI